MWQVLHIAPYPIMRDTFFYLVSIVMLFVFILDGKVEWWEGMLLMLGYFAYAGYMTQSGKVSIYLYTYIYIYIYIYICIYIFLYLYIYIYIYIYIYVFIYICAYTYICTCMYTFIPSGPNSLLGSLPLLLPQSCTRAR